MNKFFRNNTELAKKIAVMIITGISLGIGLNFFLSPAKVMSAGLNGMAQILVVFFEQSMGWNLSTGTLILVLNLPVFILAFFKLGLNSTLFSFLNVIVTALFIMVLPSGHVTDNILLNALVGGVLVGVGAGLSLKMGFTTGGFDILSLILSKVTGKTVGSYIFILNGIVVFFAGLMFSWESALYTILSIYAMSRVIDMIHVSNQKVTVFVTTRKADEVGKNISETVFRGMTLLPSIGGYSGVNSNTIMMVITRYELYDLEQAVLDVDEDAFINVVATQAIVGRFASDDDQRIFRATGAFPELKIHSNKRTNLQNKQKQV